MKKFVTHFLLLSLLILPTCFVNAQPFNNPLHIPDTLSGTIFNLDLAPGTVQFRPGPPTNTYGYNGDYLGPTLIFNKGDFIQLNVTNNLPDTTTTHWHGMHVSPMDDGGPHTPILSGQTWSPDFEVLDRATTFWYHPHLHGNTNLHVSRGAAGMIIVRDQEEAALTLPRTYGVDDIPIIIQSKSLAPNNQIEIMGPDLTLMVNGTIGPEVDCPAQMVRFRALNASSNRVYNIGVNDSRNFFQIGTDGGLLEAPVTLNRLRLSPGERAEFVVDFSGDIGNQLFLQSYADEFPPFIPGGPTPDSTNPLDGARFSFLAVNVVAPTANPVTSLPPALVPVPDFDTSDVDVVRHLTFNGGGPGNPFTIDNTLYNHHVNNHVVQLDDIEIWELENQTNASHPFHIHDIQFRILDRNGNPPPPNERGLKDVVLVLPNETVRFITQFTDFTDSLVPYMYHCHILPHEDGGMMGQFIVVDTLSTPATCDQPTGASVTAGTTTATLSWDLEPNANVTQIQYRIPPQQGGGSQGTNIAGSGATSNVLTGLVPSSQYQLRLRHNCGFDISPWKFRPFVTGSVRNGAMGNNLKIHPNPAENLVNIYLPKMGTAASAATVEVLNLHGQVVHSSREAMVTNSLVQLNTQNWLAGQYLVRFATGDFIVTKPLAIFR